MLIEKIVSLVGSGQLWIDPFSENLFKDFEGSISLHIDDHFLESAAPGDYCFVENVSVAPYAQQVEQVILFKWNRDYPGDFYFDMDISSWTLTSSEDFAGSSHDDITMETYIK
ncbi:MAG: ribonuclease Z [Oscillospiraceae bacterium]|nr:ribonuclease Z [Oscillospiraceae bacterium]